MRQIFFRPVAFRVEENRAKFQRGIVGNPELPVCGKLLGAGSGKIAVRDGEQFGDLRAAGAVGPQPTVFNPVFQAHRPLL